MAKEKIVLAELDIDTRGLIEGAVQTKKELEKLLEQQSKLTEKGKETSAQFVRNEAELRRLEAAYKAQQQAITAQLNEEGKLISQKKAIKSAVKEVNDTENDYIANSAELIRLKKELNSNEDDYEKKLARINGKLLENNNWLRENGSEHAKLITTMNDYKQQVADSFNQINMFNGGLTGLISRAQEAGGVGPLLSNAFKGITSGIGGMTKAAWGFVSNPIGAIIALLVLGVQALMSAFKNFTPLMDRVEQGMAAVGAVINTIKNSIIGFVTGAKSLGEIFSGFGDAMGEAASEAVSLKKAQQDLGREMALQEVNNEKAKNQIDDLIKKSQDRTLSEKERARALKDAGKIEEDMFNKNKKMADDAYNNALKEIEVGKRLTEEEKKNLKELGYEYAQKLAERKGIEEEELKMLQDAEIKKLAVEREGIARSKKAQDDRQAEDSKRLEDEQRRKDEGLRRDQEREQKRKKILDDAAERQKLLLDQFMQEQDGKAKSLQDELEYLRQIHEKKRIIAQAEYDASEKSANDRLKLDIARNDAKNGHLKDTAAATAEYANAEMDLFMEQHKTMIEAGKALTAQMIAEEGARLAAVRQKQLEKLAFDTGTNEQAIKAKRDNNLQLSLEDMAYLTERQRMDDEFAANKKSLEDTTRQQRAADKQLENEVALAEADTKYQQDVLTEQMRYDAELAKLEERKANKLLSEEQYNTLLAAENKKHGDILKEQDNAVAENKLNLASSTFGNLAAIMGKESAAGKAMAVAQATIDTYKAATAAYASMATIPVVGPALGAVAAGAAVAAGIANVKKITSTKSPKAEQGALFSIGGNRHSAGGTMFRGADGTSFEAEKGELIGVMNRNAARHFMAFNNAFPAGGASAPNYFAGGGLVSREIMQPALNVDELAAKLSEANRSIPAPVVAVQDIISQGSSFVKVRDGANF